MGPLGRQQSCILSPGKTCQNQIHKMTKAKKLAGAGDVVVHVQSSKKKKGKKEKYIRKFDKTASITTSIKKKKEKKKLCFSSSCQDDKSFYCYSKLRTNKTYSM